MKINKKIVAVISLVLIFVISATATLLILREPPQDNKASTSSVTTTVETTKETSEEETEEETTTQKFTTTVPTTITPTPLNNTDKKNFEELLARIVYNDVNFMNTFENYDCTSKEAFDYAIRKVFSTCYYTLLEFMDAELYKFENYEVKSAYLNNTEVEDPRNLWHQHHTTEKKYLEMVLKNVFNVELGNQDIFYDYYGNTLAYIEGDTCYIYCGDGGDGAGPVVKIKDIKTSSDGNYIISASYTIQQYDGEILEIRPDLKVTASIKTVEGKRLWSIRKIEMSHLPESESLAYGVLDPSKEYKVSYTPTKQGIARCSLPLGSDVIDYFPADTRVSVLSDDEENNTGFVFCWIMTHYADYYDYLPKVYLEENGDSFHDYSKYNHICYNTPDHAGVNLRAEPNSTSKIYETILEGDVLEIAKPVERSGEYIKVIYHHRHAGEDYTGWILEKYVK